MHLLASEGIGTGVVINGKTITGYRGIFGEVGHMSIDAMGAKCVCGNYGCLEMYCSALALVRDVLMELPKHPDSSLNGEAQITADAVRLYILDRQEEGELKARDILPLINLELDQPGNILEDYMSLGQEDARIETVVVDIATGDLSQLTYRTPDCRVRLTWNSEGRLTVEYPQEGI